MRKIKSLLIITSLGSLLGCQKDIQDNFRPIATTDSDTHYLLPSCDDTTAFKSELDLVQLDWLQDCDACSSIKEVPGLGFISWNANTRALMNDNKISLFFNTYYPYMNLMLQREELYLSNIPSSAGLYPLFDDFHYLQNMNDGYGLYYRAISDGDVSDGYWDIDTLCSSFIEITQVDLECMEIRGKFEVHLKMVEPSEFYQYSERINFINGKFEARIREY